MFSALLARIAALALACALSCIPFESAARDDSKPVTKFGNTVYHPDGTSETTYGATTIRSTGEASTRYGKTVYGADGTAESGFGSTRIYTAGGTSLAVTDIGASTILSGVAVKPTVQGATTRLMSGVATRTDGMLNTSVAEPGRDAPGTTPPPDSLETLDTEAVFDDPTERRHPSEKAPTYDSRRYKN